MTIYSSQKKIEIHTHCSFQLSQHLSYPHRSRMADTVPEQFYILESSNGPLDETRFMSLIKILANIPNDQALKSSDYQTVNKRLKNIDGNKMRYSLNEFLDITKFMEEQTISDEHEQSKELPNEPPGEYDAEITHLKHDTRKLIKFFASLPPNESVITDSNAETVIRVLAGVSEGHELTFLNIVNVSKKVDRLLAAGRIDMCGADALFKRIRLIKEANKAAWINQMRQESFDIANEIARNREELATL